MSPVKKTSADRKSVAKQRNKSLNVRLTAQEHKRLLALGGSAWVREQLDHASRPMISVACRAIGSTELIYNKKALKATLLERTVLLMDAAMLIDCDLNTTNELIVL